MQGEAFRAAAAVGDQIDLVEAGPRGGGPPMRELRPGRRQEPRERGATDLPQELVDGRRQGQVAALGEPVEKLRHKRLESMGADAATGLL